MMKALDRFVKRYWDEAAVYAFTVLCVFLGDYILHKTRPDVGFLPMLSAVVVAALICLGVGVMAGNPDTEEKRKAKKNKLPKRILFSGLAGAASSAVVPAMVKTAMSAIGIEV